MVNIMNNLNVCSAHSYSYPWSVPDLGQMRPCASEVMRPLTWAMKEVDPVGTQTVRRTCSGNLGIVKILRYQTSKTMFDRKMGPLANGALCLNTPKHNGKSGTAHGPGLSVKDG